VPVACRRTSGCTLARAQDGDPFVERPSRWIGEHDRSAAIWMIRMILQTQKGSRCAAALVVVALILVGPAEAVCQSHTSGVDACASGEDRAQLQAAALRGWRPFVAAFRRALKQRDRAALRRMMAPNFWSWPAQMQGRDVAFDTWDDPYLNGWHAFDQLLRKRSVWASDWYRTAGEPWRPIRIAPREANLAGNPGAPGVEWFALFRYEPDGRWYCTMFSGCCE
jgi:hypothetical protein